MIRSDELAKLLLVFWCLSLLVRHLQLDESLASTSFAFRLVSAVFATHLAVVASCAARVFGQVRKVVLRGWKLRCKL